MPKIMLEYRDESLGDRWIEVRWPTVPRQGECVCVCDETGESYNVFSVLWRQDGTAVVRLR